MTKVKICGITNLQDARLAVKFGADALGFVFARSPRCVSPAKAAAIIQQLPVFVKCVGVFVNSDKKSVLDILKKCRLDILQFHGDESDNYCAFFQKYCKIIKAFRIKDENSLKSVSLYEHVDAYLFDTYEKGRYGGTGKAFSYNALKKFKSDKPVIIAGGISPENVEEVLRQTKPYALDVSSGIEVTPGKKNARRMHSVIEKVKWFPVRTGLRGE
ncbi:MAG: phosphoribosylanthranilate isomerase [Candidatus Omnitrophica bacterium]|nr:phosphoribosylanthranilate isomerase [Candidatus Omnitrophota bacterium]MBU4479472.1 phosphoribosylanthranilate isomerase [Candidatus Omnitrophota bacterium]